MSPITVVALVACLAFTSAQLQPTNTGVLGGGTASTLGSNLLGAVAAANNQRNTGMGAMNPMNAMNAMNAMNTMNTMNANGNANANNPMGSLFSNPLMSYGLMGGDNMMRAMMMPYMSRFGNNAAHYYLRGGMDKMSSVLMSDMMNRALARSTGMNPQMSAFMTGQMFDAPDNYALNNMLFNGNGGGRAGGNGGAAGGGMFGNMGASPNNVGGSGFNPLLLATMMN